MQGDTITTQLNQNSIQSQFNSIATQFNHSSIQPKINSIATQFNHNSIQPKLNSTKTQFNHNSITINSTQSNSIQSIKIQNSIQLSSTRLNSTQHNRQLAGLLWFAELGLIDGSFDLKHAALFLPLSAKTDHAAITRRLTWALSDLLARRRHHPPGTAVCQTCFSSSS